MEQSVSNRLGQKLSTNEWIVYSGVHQLLEYTKLVLVVYQHVVLKPKTPSKPVDMNLNGMNQQK